MEPQRVSDELEIASLLTRYARAVDSRDWDLYRSVFTDDATIDYSAIGVTVTARDEVAAALAEFVSGQSMSMHYVMNVESEFDVDVARVQAMWLNAVALEDESKVSQYGGRWHHDLVRTGAGWRSRKLRLEVVW
jgi:3-phenylpropionate/cinnamic acid dioxygenase small subunit